MRLMELTVCNPAPMSEFVHFLGQGEERYLPFALFCWSFFFLVTSTLFKLKSNPKTTSLFLQAHLPCFCLTLVANCSVSSVSRSNTTHPAATGQNYPLISFPLLPLRVIIHSNSCGCLSGTKHYHPHTSSLSPTHFTPTSIGFDCLPSLQVLVFILPIPAAAVDTTTATTAT